jgi:hypothetical protein|tara:strand:+ start:706 stop:1188 length:483 start_codon:yes stop_codon:yes gene_type:complete
METDNHELEEFEGIDLSEDNSVRADRMLWKIRKLEEDIYSYEEKKSETNEFYDLLIGKKQDQIDHRKVMLKTHLESTGKKTEKFSSGILRMRKRERISWSSDDELLQFSYANKIDTKITEKPVRKSIIKYAKETGDFPSGVTVESVEDFSYTTHKVTTED